MILSIILRDVTTSQPTLGCACKQRCFFETFYTSVSEKTGLDIAWAVGWPWLRWRHCDRSKRQHLGIVICWAAVKVEISVPGKVNVFDHIIGLLKASQKIKFPHACWFLTLLKDTLYISLSAVTAPENDEFGRTWKKTAVACCEVFVCRLARRNKINAPKTQIWALPKINKLL